MLSSAARNEDANHQVSVIIPTRDRANLLDMAIASVLRSPLIVSPEQVIVVDDDSRDRTEVVARKHPVSYVRANSHNISLSRNTGLALAQTAYVAFLDDDDVWLPGNMEPQLAALERHPDAAFAYGIARCATEDLEPLSLTFPSPPLPSGIVPEQLHRGYPNLGVALFRRDAVRRVGGFDPAIRYHQDAELLLRIAASHEIVGRRFRRDVASLALAFKSQSRLLLGESRSQLLDTEAFGCGMAGRDRFPLENEGIVLLSLLRGRVCLRFPRASPGRTGVPVPGTAGFSAACFASLSDRGVSHLVRLLQTAVDLRGLQMIQPCD